MNFLLSHKKILRQHKHNYLIIIAKMPQVMEIGMGGANLK